MNNTILNINSCYSVSGVINYDCIVKEVCTSINTQFVTGGYYIVFGSMLVLLLHGLYNLYFYKFFPNRSYFLIGNPHIFYDRYMFRAWLMERIATISVIYILLWITMS